MARTHVIIPVMQRPTQSSIDPLRARFASILIDALPSNPTPEAMDRIERLLWGRTLGPSQPDSSNGEGTGR